VKLGPPCLSVDALTAAKVGAEIFDMDLDSCPVRGERPSLGLHGSKEEDGSTA
jgi:hypothetical protein